MKEEKRAAFRKKNENLANLVAEIWPCNNYYISVCEDAAHGFTKGKEHYSAFSNANKYFDLKTEDKTLKALFTTIEAYC